MNTVRIVEIGVVNDMESDVPSNLISARRVLGSKMRVGIRFPPV